MKQYKVLFFDFDDTLFDFAASETIALSGTFRRYGIADTEEMYTLFRSYNQAFWRAFEKGIYKNESDSAVRFQGFTEAIGRSDIDYREMCEYYLDRLSETAFEIDGSVALLAALSKKYDIYIVSNSLERVNVARCKVGGILPYIQGQFLSERIGVSKPNKGFFDYCFAHIDYTKEQTLMIGDSLVSDMKGGIDYGIDTCWFNRNGNKNKEKLPVTYEIHSLQQLKELL